LGVGVTAALPPIVLALMPGVNQTAKFFAPDWATFTFALVLSLVTALACGLAPALYATRVGLSKLTSERHGQTAATARLRRVLLATQIALATVLLVGAGLLTRGISHASAMDPGFPIAEFQEVTIQFPGGLQGPRRNALYQQLFAMTRTETWPPITLSDFAPIDSEPYVLPLRTSAKMPPQIILSRGISPNYFETLGIRLLSGRAPRASDDGRELVLSRAAAEKFWPGENPIGKTLFSGFRSEEIKIHLVVGLAPDLPVKSLTATDPVAYTSAQLFSAVVLVRSLDSGVVTRLRDATGRIDPDVTLSARPLNAIVADSLFVAVIGSAVAWAIGGIGLALAAMGVFGVFSYAVEGRRREIGIRMALGAQTIQIVRLVLGTTQRSVLIGLAAGVVLAGIGSPLLSRYLYGLSPFDPVAYLQTAGMLIASAIVATWIPARRAASVNPAVTLRAE
jgi:predicted permease